MMPVPVCFGMVSKQLTVREGSRTGAASNNVVQLVVVDCSCGKGWKIQQQKEDMFSTENIYKKNVP
jgi:hypothetical protein